MGQELITIGWTARFSDYDKDAVQAALATITNDWLHEHAEALDPNGTYATPIGNEFCYILAELRLALLTGAEDYDTHLNDGHRYGTNYGIQSGDALTFYLAGGGSSGDDPYDGFSALGVFIGACFFSKELAAAAGFFGGGIRP